MKTLDKDIEQRFVDHCCDMHPDLWESEVEKRGHYYVYKTSLEVKQDETDRKKPRQPIIKMELWYGPQDYNGKHPCLLKINGIEINDSKFYQNLGKLRKRIQDYLDEQELEIKLGKLTELYNQII